MFALLRCLSDLPESGAFDFWFATGGEGPDLPDTMLAMGRPNRNLPAPVLGWGVRMYARRLQPQAGPEVWGEPP